MNFWIPGGLSSRQCCHPSKARDLVFFACPQKNPQGTSHFQTSSDAVAAATSVPRKFTASLFSTLRRSSNAPKKLSAIMPTHRRNH